MGAYPYECEKGHKFEVQLRPNDPRPTTCPQIIDHAGKGLPEPRQCGAAVEYLWPPVAWSMDPGYDHHHGS